MVNYNYDVNKEAFVRSDKRGRALYVNISEANRIISLLDLGHSITDIQMKVVLVNPKGTATTVKNFIKNYTEGKINMPENAPAPSKIFQSLTDNDRLNNLEERVSKLEEIIENNNVISKNDENSLTDKVKSWMKR